MWGHETEQIGIRCSIIRGGTSKGVYFHANDVPPPGPDRDQLAAFAVRDDERVGRWRERLRSVQDLI